MAGRLCFQRPRHRALEGSQPSSSEVGIEQVVRINVRQQSRHRATLQVRRL